MLVCTASIQEKIEIKKIRICNPVGFQMRIHFCFKASLEAHFNIKSVFISNS